jgi:hypothetical protein
VLQIIEQAKTHTVIAQIEEEQEGGGGVRSAGDAMY